jgi:hypothetical protein
MTRLAQSQGGIPPGLREFTDEDVKAAAVVDPYTGDARAAIANPEAARAAAVVDPYGEDPGVAMMGQPADMSGAPFGAAEEFMGGLGDLGNRLKQNLGISEETKIKQNPDGTTGITKTIKGEDGGTVKFDVQGMDLTPLAGFMDSMYGTNMHGKFLSQRRADTQKRQAFAKLQEQRRMNAARQAIRQKDLARKERQAAQDMAVKGLELRFRQRADARAERRLGSDLQAAELRNEKMIADAKQAADKLAFERQKLNDRKDLDQARVKKMQADMKMKENKLRDYAEDRELKQKEIKAKIKYWKSGGGGRGLGGTAYKDESVERQQERISKKAIEFYTPVSDMVRLLGGAKTNPDFRNRIRNPNSIWQDMPVEYSAPMSRFLDKKGQWIKDDVLILKKQLLEIRKKTGGAYDTEKYNPLERGRISRKAAEQVDEDLMRILDLAQRVSDLGD